MNAKRISSVFELIAMIPEGKVTTYGQIAEILSIGPRQVGWILHRNTDPERLPCHRVIKSNGAIAAGYAFGGPRVQARKLEQEGVVFQENGRIDLPKYGYRFPLSIEIVKR